MPLSEDSRALLQLLLGRGQSYGDISGILGVEPAEVRSRAKAALAEMAGRDPDARAPLTDYLLGQADPIDRASAAKHLADDEEDNRTAHQLADQLRLVVPAARLPELPAERRASATSSSASGASGAPAPGRGRQSSPLASRQVRLIALLIGAAVLVAVLVLVITGAFGGDDDGNDGGNRAASSSPAPTQANLSPVDGNSGSGSFLLGRVGQSPVVNLQLSGLEPAPEGQTYWLWLYRSDNGAVNFLPITPNASGAFEQSVQVPNQLLQLIAGGLTGIRVSLADDDELRREVNQAGEKRLPRYVGETVLTGQLTGALAELAETLRRQARQGGGQAGANGGQGGSDAG